MNVAPTAPVPAPAPQVTIAPTPTITPRFKPKYYVTADSVHSAPITDALEHGGWLEVCRRYFFPAMDRGAIPVVRLVAERFGDLQLPIYNRDLLKVRELFPKFGAYSRGAARAGELAEMREKWLRGGKYFWWMDATAGAGALHASIDQARRDVVLEADPLNGAEPWPDRMDPTAGTLGTVVIQHTEWMKKVWPENYKPRDIAPPGGVVRYWDVVFGNEDKEVPPIIENCVAAGHDIAMPVDTFLRMGKGVAAAVA